MTLREPYDHRMNFFGPNDNLKILRFPQDQRAASARCPHDEPTTCLRAKGYDFFQICTVWAYTYIIQISEFKMQKSAFK